jgi:hypothetical protein
MKNTAQEPENGLTINNELPLHDICYLQSKIFLALAETIEIQLEDDFFSMDWYDPTCYASEILDAKYEKVIVDDVIDQLDHLNTQQKMTLKESSMSILNYLMALWEFILTENFTLI